MYLPKQFAGFARSLCRESKKLKERRRDRARSASPRTGTEMQWQIRNSRTSKPLADRGLLSWAVSEHLPTTTWTKSRWRWSFWFRSQSSPSVRWRGVKLCGESSPMLTIALGVIRFVVHGMFDLVMKIDSESHLDHFRWQNTLGRFPSGLQLTFRASNSSNSPDDSVSRFFAHSWFRVAISKLGNENGDSSPRIKKNRSIAQFSSDRSTNTTATSTGRLGFYFNCREWANTCIYARARWVIYIFCQVINTSA